MADNLLSTDADPDPPRPRNSLDETQTVYRRQNIGEQTMMERIQQDIPIPTADWAFHHFLGTLANQITPVELKNMKVIFSGDGGIGRGALSKAETPLQLFDLLERRRWLTRDNLLYLQTALKTINRMDLVRTAAEYALSIDNVLHFYPASAQPENGYRLVKLHVRGHNYQNATRDDIQQIRRHFAELLFAPPECIIISGIEPATSLLLTLQAPESYVVLLIYMLKSDANQSRFKDIGVDCIEIQHYPTLFQLSGKSEATTKVREQHKKLYNVYQQLENTKKQVEVYEIELLELKDRLKEYEKKSFEQALLKTMETKLVSPLDDNEIPASCFVEKQLERQELESYDKTFILYLIAINTRVVANAETEDNQVMEEKIKMMAIKELKSRICPLQFELLKLRDFWNQESVYEKILQETTSVIQRIATIQEDEKLRQVLKTISRDMRNHDRVNLEKKYNWEPYDPLKQAMDNDRSFFLTGILYKKIKITNTFVEPGEFISHCLEAVGRTDLLREFQSLVAAMKADKMDKPSVRNEGTCVNLSTYQQRVQIMEDQIEQVCEIVSQFTERHNDLENLRISGNSFHTSLKLLGRKNRWSEFRVG